MEPDLAKRNSLGIDRNSSPAEKTRAQFNNGFRRKETLANESKTGKEIETLVLQKLTTKPIPLARLVRELSNDLAYTSDKIIAKIASLQADRKILIREPVPYKRFLDYLLSPLSIWFWEQTLATHRPYLCIIRSCALPPLHIRGPVGPISPRVHTPRLHLLQERGR